MNQQLFAFWSYDSFPFVLGARVREITLSGRVIPEGYGGYTFKPLLILPYQEGVRVWEEISKLSAEYSRARLNFDKEWREKLNKFEFMKGV